MKTLAVVFVALFILAGCGGKTYWQNQNPNRNFSQDSGYCQGVAYNSAPMPQMQQYQSNIVTPYAPSSGIMHDQYGNVYTYRENYNALAASQNYMAQAQQSFNNAAIGLQNFGAQLDAQAHREALFNQCMSQQGWYQISKQEYDRPNQTVKPQRNIQETADQRNTQIQAILLYVSDNAIEWFQKAAAEGNEIAQTYLAQAKHIYFERLKIQKDYKKLAEWLQKLAEQGDAMGQCLLGVMYAKGDGVFQD